jgi:TatD DNase family protein
VTRGITDTHAHIHDRCFDPDRAEVLERAHAAGVKLVLAMGEGRHDNERVLAVSRAHAPGWSEAGAAIRPCLGLHPDRAAEEPLGPVADQIRAHAGELAAIGEVGLDYWVARDDEPRARQREVFSGLVKLASDLELPISVHSRSAGHHVVDLLLELDARRVCLHAFDGRATHAARAAEAGYLLSVPPSVTRSPQKQKMVRRLSLDALLLETDSPVLGPDREARNEPANAARAASAVAELKGCTVDEVVEVTAANAARLFRLPR